jgi:electron transfer flavoprotein alpha subunit
VDIKLNSAVKIFSLRPNVFKAEHVDGGIPSVEDNKIDFNDADFSVVVKETTVSSEKIDVAEANIIVSGGRGLKTPENYHLGKNWQSPGAGVGVTRCCRCRWRPHSNRSDRRQNSFMNMHCLRISGAIQHWPGSHFFKCIVAINK